MTYGPSHLKTRWKGPNSFGTLFVIILIRKFIAGPPDMTVEE